MTSRGGNSGGAETPIAALTEAECCVGAGRNGGGGANVYAPDEATAATPGSAAALRRRQVSARERSDSHKGGMDQVEASAAHEGELGLTEDLHRFPGRQPKASTVAMQEVQLTAWDH